MQLGKVNLLGEEGAAFVNEEVRRRNIGSGTPRPPRDLAAPSAASLPASFVARVTGNASDQQGIITVTKASDSTPIPAGVYHVFVVECAEGTTLPQGTIVIAHAVAVQEVDGEPPEN